MSDKHRVIPYQLPELIMIYIAVCSTYSIMVNAMHVCMANLLLLSSQIQPLINRCLHNFRNQFYLHVLSISCTVTIKLVAFMNNRNFLVLLDENMVAISQLYVLLHFPFDVCHSLILTFK